MEDSFRLAVINCSNFNFQYVENKNCSNRNVTSWRLKPLSTNFLWNIFNITKSHHCLKLITITSSIILPKISIAKTFFFYEFTLFLPIITHPHSLQSRLISSRFDGWVRRYVHSSKYWSVVATCWMQPHFMMKIRCS